MQQIRSCRRNRSSLASLERGTREYFGVNNLLQEAAVTLLQAEKMQGLTMHNGLKRCLRSAFRIV